MGFEELDRLRKEFEDAKKEYEFWTTGGNCMPGSQKWGEVTARYTSARDAYQLALQHKNEAVQPEQGELIKLDSLLQIRDRGHFDKDLQRMTAQAGATFPLSMMMIDLDDFKLVNDTYGHMVGDFALQKFASIVKLACEAKGFCYRYGGDEIAVLLPNYTLEEAAVLAHRISAEFNRTRFEEGPGRITASIGVSCYPESTEFATQLIKAADDAMYKAKGAGKNQVCGAELAKVAGRKVSRVTPIGDVQRRVDAVQLSVSVDSGYASNFLILVKNHSDEEITVKEVRLESDGYRLAEPAHPPSKEPWKVKPQERSNISWRANPDPVVQLMRMHPNEGQIFNVGIDIVLQCEILSKSRTFSQKVLVRVDVNNRYLQQLVG